MTGTIAALVMHTVLMAPAAKPYGEALQASQKNGKPLLVLVSAPWCPACQVMKNTVLKPMEDKGELKGIEWATVNIDNEASLARKFMKGSSIPQLIMFEKTDKGWRRTHYVGVQSAEKIDAMVRSASVDTVITAAKPNADSVKK